MDITTARLLLTHAALHDLQEIRVALLLLTTEADHKLIGICADTMPQAVQALHGYLRAFGYTEPSITGEVPERSGVFLKFNPLRGTCFVSSYEGPERGVIVSCFSPDSGGNNETYGGLPFTLFDS
jgi:hypothetical protein